MKKTILFFTCIAISIICFCQTVTTGKIEGLKDGWGESITYVGEIKNGKPNGLGLAIYSNKFALRYAGYFVNGSYEGKGAILYEDGSFLSGDWKGGKLNGQGAHYSNGKDLYVGGFADGKKSGTGTYLFKDNSFVQGNFMNDTYSGRCIFIAKDADIISDNIYVDGKKNGAGYQYEVKDKKLFQGEWKNGDWLQAATGNYKSFLNDSKFYGEKTEKQILMGGLDSKNLLEDTAFFYDLQKRKRYFGIYSKGNMDKGIIIRDDSTRFIGNINDNGAYGDCSFLKFDKFFDQGNFVNDYLNGPKVLSINLDKKNIYYGQSVGSTEFTGPAWFANNYNELFLGNYEKGKFTGEGWRIDKTGYLLKGTWKDGIVTNLKQLINEQGMATSTTPKTLSEAITITAKTFNAGFYTLQSETSDLADLSWLSALYNGVIKFPGSTENVIGEDIDGYGYYISFYEPGNNEAAAIKQYKDFCAQVKAASITLKKGGSALKLSGEINEPATDKDFNASSFTFPENTEGYKYFAVSVVLIKKADGSYNLMTVCGDKDGLLNWEDDMKDL